MLVFFIALTNTFFLYSYTLFHELLANNAVSIINVIKTTIAPVDNLYNPRETLSLKYRWINSTNILDKPDDLCTEWKTLYTCVM